LQRRDPQDEASEEGRCEKEDQEQAISAAMAGDEVGHRPCKDETDQRCRERAKDGACEESAIGGFAEQSPVVVQIPIGIELIALGAPETENEDSEQRQQKRQQDEENAWTRKQEEWRWAAPHEPTS
jgi:hypothetical protein